MGFKHSMADGVPFPAVPWILYQAHFGILRRKTGHDLRRTIARAVVDDNNFGAPSVLAHMGHHRLQRAADALVFVVGGDNDAVFWLHSTQAGTISKGSLELPTSGSPRWSAIVFANTTGPVLKKPPGL